MKKERILITGIAGSIGSELARQLAGREDESVYGLDINESGLYDIITETGVSGRVGDVRSYDTVNDVLSDIKPTIIYHAAAYKSVDFMELVPMEAIQTNVIGTYNILHNAQRYEVPKVVFISSDKAVNADSVMGQTKKLGETMARNKGYCAVRFGNVLGSRGSVTKIWEQQINQGKPVTVTDPNMTRFFMTIPEAVALLIEAGSNAKPGSLYIMDMGKPIKIIDLANKIIEELRAEVPIKIIGKRPGETMTERLMTEEEEHVAKKEGKFWVLCK